MSNETTPERSPQTEPQPAAPAAEQPAAEGPQAPAYRQKGGPRPGSGSRRGRAPQTPPQAHRQSV